MLGKWQGNPCKAGGDPCKGGGVLQGHPEITFGQKFSFENPFLLVFMSVS